MSAPPSPAWHRLAHLLAQRRTELGWRYRKDFAEHHGMNSDRFFDDLENARRRNYKKSTLARAEQLYQWAPGSIATVLDGGEPSPLEPRQGHLRYLRDFSNEELLLELGRRIALRDERLAHLVDESQIASALQASRGLTKEDAEQKRAEQEEVEQG